MYRIDPKMAIFYFPYNEISNKWELIDDPKIAPYYYVNENSDIFSLYMQRECVQINNYRGYKIVSLNSAKEDGHRYQRKVHRLSMKAFKPIEGCDKLEINHIDGNKSNNHINNLEWCTGKQNIAHATENNLMTPHTRRINKDIARKVKILLNEGYKHKEIVEQIPEVTLEIVNNISIGRSWKNVKI